VPWTKACAAALIVTAWLAPPRRVEAWGCEGHQIVALVAERHLGAAALARARQVLKGGPIDPGLKRGCSARGLDAFADASTWADDYRNVDESTAGWHFLDIPRGADRATIAQDCPASGCLTSAIAAQVALLRAPGTDAQTRANALRFVIHFAGDLHQPLHATTNDDRGGNCVPVKYFDQAPAERIPGSGNFSPNLHGVWDTSLVMRAAKGQAVKAVAAKLDAQLQAQEPSWIRGGVDPIAWAWESHQVAEDAAYGKLPHPIPIETPQPVASCKDDRDIAARMLALHETLGASYAAAVTPVVQQQLVKAGVRLALVLNQVWPTAP
jgi:hypothetical protein